MEQWRQLPCQILLHQGLTEDDQSVMQVLHEGGHSLYGSNSHYQSWTGDYTDVRTTQQILRGRVGSYVIIVDGVRGEADVLNVPPQL